jgi:hypothetical protein
METKELFNLKSIFNEAELDKAYAITPHLFAIGKDCDKGYSLIALKQANEKWGELYKGRRYDEETPGLVD